MPSYQLAELLLLVEYGSNLSAHTVAHHSRTNLATNRKSDPWR
jgi:hypothetical protein